METVENHMVIDHLWESRGPTVRLNPLNDPDVHEAIAETLRDEISAEMVRQLLNREEWSAFRDIMEIVSSRLEGIIDEASRYED